MSSFCFYFSNSFSWFHCFTNFNIHHFLLSRLFKVNGEPIFIRGGNWILSDGLLRLSKERYKTDIKFHADMNFNMIRCWGGGIAERPEFYHYCDIYGLLVIIGPCWEGGFKCFLVFLFPPSYRSGKNSG